MRAISAPIAVRYGKLIDAREQREMKSPCGKVTDWEESDGHRSEET